jgi:molybdopterin synthase catalytic subunit
MADDELRRTRAKDESRMKRELTITTDPIDERALAAARLPSHGMGAVICFSGLVRASEEGRAISSIDYECFQPMAEHQFHKLFDELEKRWPVVESVRLVHRIGVVKVNEPSLWVEVVTPHRGEAFLACQWLIDEMKRVVPIWKRPVHSA